MSEAPPRATAARAIDVFYCTNAVNYTIAMEGLLRGSPHRAIVLYKGKRYRPQARAGVWAWRVSYPSFVALRLLARLWPMGTLYVPHHRIPSGLRALVPRMARMAFIDDGMDTLRERPSNFDLERLPAVADYFTFRDYTDLPAWVQRLKVHRVCDLKQMVDLSQKPAFDLTDIDHVFFESPGLDTQALIAARALDVARVLVVRHPVVAKQGPLPEGCSTVLGSECNPEATLLAARGKHFYFGETMAGIFALRCGPAAHNTLWFQLKPAQWANLVGLAALTPVPELALASPVKVLRPGDNPGHDD